jgi:hypothetical protein
VLEGLFVQVAVVLVALYLLVLARKVARKVVRKPSYS